MGDDLSTKNLVGRCARDPWKAVMSNLPLNYQIREIGMELIEQVDRALFERKLHAAMFTGIILERWAEHDLQFNAKAPAVLAAIYAVAQVHSEAERQIAKAQKRTNPKWADCHAHYLKRLGTVHAYRQEYKKSHDAYNSSAKLYQSIGQERDAALSIMNRGVIKCLLRAYDDGLEDEEYALSILRPEFGMTTIMCLINIASIYVIQRKIDLAIAKIEETQRILIGEDALERPKIILRWIRALLLEAQDKLKDAGEMIDRIEPSMRKLDMKPELRVLLADRARIARQPGAIKRIAKKALNIEDVPRIRELIEQAIEYPTRENISKWRNSLDAYVPPFPSTL